LRGSVKVFVLSVSILLASQSAFSADKSCLSILLGDLLLKTTNQVYHVKSGKFYYMRRLHAKLKSGHYPRKSRWVKLSELEYMHPVDYPIERMWQKVQTRVDALNRQRDIIAKHGLSLADQKHLIPSGGEMTVIEDLDGKLIVKDGNGRLHALREVFKGQDIRIEVQQIMTDDYEVYYFLQKLRQAGHLE
jgi:hypothetical protein